MRKIATVAALAVLILFGLCSESRADFFVNRFGQTVVVNGYGTQAVTGVPFSRTVVVQRRGLFGLRRQVIVQQQAFGGFGGVGYAPSVAFVPAGGYGVPSATFVAPQFQTRFIRGVGFVTVRVR